MRQLHVLGVSDDGDTLLLGTSAKGKVTHRISLDNRLRKAVSGQLTAPGADRAESVLSPKEIQARLRAGATPDEVAKIARVPVARVLPYFAPVEAERERIVEEARSAVLHRPRGPQSTQPLGTVVDARLREVAGLKDDSVVWTARRRADGAWVVRLSYGARGGTRRAEWLWRPLGRELTALDASATRLAAEVVAAPKRKPVRRPAAKKAAPVRKAAAAAKKPAKKAASGTTKRAAPVAKKAAPATKKAAPAAKKAAAPAAKRAAPAARKAAPVAKKAATKAVPAARKAATRAPRPVVSKPTSSAPPPRPRVLEVVPDPVPDVVEVAAPAVVVVEPKPARKPGARVPIPSWSDVLFGVTGRDPDPDPGPNPGDTDAPRRTSSGGRRRRT